MNKNTILKPLNKLWTGAGNSIFRHIPNITINATETYDKIGNALSRPDVNRAIMGGTAIVTQPFIDYYNPNVDEDTAKISTCRTIGKIIAGTFVGCAVRFVCYQTIKGLTNINPDVADYKKSLLPSSSMVFNYIKKNHGEWLKKYRNVLSTVLSLFAMLFTNVLFDVPITNKITKKLMHMFHLNNNNTNNTNPEGADTTSRSKDPRQKIIDSFDRLHTTQKGGDK